MTLSEADIRDLGVKNGAHRARLVSSLVMLREAQQSHGKKATFHDLPSQPHSLVIYTVSQKKFPPIKTL